MVKRAVRRSKRKITRAGAATKPAKMYRTSMRDVPKVAGLKRKDGWVDMQVQFLIDKASAGAEPCGRLDRAQAGGAPRAAPPSQLRRVLHRAQGPRPYLYRRRRGPVGRRRRRLFAAQVLAQLQQHLERGCRAGVGLDGRRLDRGFGYEVAAEN